MHLLCRTTFFLRILEESHSGIAAFSCTAHMVRARFSLMILLANAFHQNHPCGSSGLQVVEIVGTA